MNQAPLLHALKELVEDNEATLVSGFTHQGAARSIAQISLSTLDAPRDFYFVLIVVPEVVSRRALGTRTRKESIEHCTYDCDIHFVDAAFTQPGEELSYQQMTLDFRLMIDRMVAIIRATGCFSADAPYDTTTFEVLNEADGGRVVTVRNEDQSWYDADEAFLASWLYSTVSFQVEEMIVP